MKSKVGLIKVEALVKSQHNNVVNCQALEISPEIYGDFEGDFTFLANLVHSISGLLL